MEISSGGKKRRKKTINILLGDKYKIAVWSVCICVLDSRQITKRSGEKIHLYVNAGLIIFILQARRKAMAERQEAIDRF